MIAQQIETALGVRPQQIQPLHGGSIGQVYLVKLPDAQRVVAKVSQHLTLEAQMLEYLHQYSQLPLPEVLYSDSTLLILSYIEGNSQFGRQEQQHAAELIAELHSVKGTAFGFEYDTVIGALPQPNPVTGAWIPFFRDARLLHMANLALKEGRLSAQLYQRLETLAARLDEWLLEPDYPTLLHGDLWTTNMLAQDGHITGFLDPAVYYGHPEIELAFTTLFNTFGSPFFERYNALRPIPPGFFEVRRDIYNLYPLLVHVRLFGSGYLSPIDTTLRRLGL